MIIQNNIFKVKPSSVFLICFLLVVTATLKAENMKPLVSLEGTWKFTIGDDPAWAQPEYNDREWDYVYVPRSWEGSGFIDYNGFAWYRKAFDLSGEIDEEPLFLLLGYIDDVDEVYLNGHLIGTSGIFPPLVKTAYNQFRKYPVPKELLNKEGKNVIAVRVYDEYLDGGIVNGSVGIYYDQDNLLLSLNLAGYWDFEPTNKAGNFTKKVYNQEDGKIFVPAFWESMGYADYDGSAVYSRNFRIPDRFDDQEMMIVVGYIDDIDKVYINDVKVGTVSDLKSGENRDKPEHLILRGYDIPADLLKKGGLNTIRVKVYDTQLQGGIYEGPIGLITEGNYKLLKEKQQEKSFNMWDDFFKSIFE